MLFGQILEHIPIQQALEFTKYLGNETDISVWDQVTRHFTIVRNLYRNLPYAPESDIEALAGSLGRRMSAVMNQIPYGWEQVYSADSLLFSTLLDWTCSFSYGDSGSQWCFTYAKMWLDEWQKDESRNP